MPNTSEDPVDHARTTRQHAGETMIPLGVALADLKAGRSETAIS